MCAILFSNDEEISIDKFKIALAQMNTRGPDATDTLTHQEFKLGHNRLKILDLDNHANQPFYSDDKRYAIIFNGEIYNFKELAEKFNISTFTSSDTEVLLKLYILLGKKCLDELNGMFAFIIFDFKTNKYFIARDRLGIKPLYYMKKDEKFIFSSEINAILELSNNHDFDEIGLRQYKKLRTFFRGHTIYKNIFMMEAGSYFENGIFYKYWNLPDLEYQSEPSDEELYSLIKSSVDYRCISDVPIGCYLSGGLDSSIISSLVNRSDTWTVGYNDNNEFIWSDIMAKKLYSKHNKITLQYNQFKNSLTTMISKRKEVLSVPNEVLLYEMTKKVKERNTVVLSGEGADELFFGYDRIFKWANDNSWDITEFDKMYSYGKHKDLEIIDYIMEPYKHYKSNINKIAAFFQISHLHGLLRRLDSSTMLASVEARVPFVDHRLVERMVAVPFSYRMQNNIVKAPLKRVFEKNISAEIINRKKIGFPVDLSKVFLKNEYSQWLDYNLEILKKEM